MLLSDFVKLIQGVECSMKEYHIEKSQVFKFLWLSLIPLVVLISIQFLVVAQVSDGSEDLETSIIQNSDDYLTDILKNDISSHYLFSFSGKASHYAHRFHNRKTASGERFNMFENTAAHRKLPFGTIIKVTNLANGQTTLVKINDRGPHVSKRVLDLSYGAAKEIEGLGLPQLKIEGFLRGKHNIGTKFNQDYVYAYSLNQSPVCVPRTIASIVDSCDDFQQAYEMYQSMLKKSESNTFLFVSSDGNPNDGDKYYIGTIGKPKSFKGYLSKL